jgi:hypothetical protein
MGGAAAFIEATTTGVTEVLLEHLTRFEGFGAVLDDRFTLAIFANNGDESTFR